MKRTGLRTVRTDLLSFSIMISTRCESWYEDVPGLGGDFHKRQLALARPCRPRLHTPPVADMAAT